MKILLDVLGAPASSGGMRAYAEELVQTWADLGCDDVHVAGGAWIADAFGSMPECNLHVMDDGGWGRLYAQWFRVGALGQRLGVDGIHSVSPIVSPLGSRGVVLSSTIHDWRHLRNPKEFSVWQRVYRSSYGWVAKRVAFSVQISSKTAAETKSYVPRAKQLLAPSGTDHAKRWEGTSAGDKPDGLILTFGHHNNKRPDRVIEALPDIIKSHPAVHLTVLGAMGGWREYLRSVAKHSGVLGSVHFPGYVEDREYRSLLQQASVVVLMSSDEGFGLPVAEAAFFGVPVVAAEENGVSELHSCTIFTCDPDNEGSIATAISEALDVGPLQPKLSGPSWASTVRTIRKGIEVSLRLPRGRFTMIGVRQKSRRTS